MLKCEIVVDIWVYEEKYLSYVGVIIKEEEKEDMIILYYVF